MKNVISITDRVKRLRNEKGLSYQALEDLTSISRSTLQRYEMNNFERCTLDKIKCIAKALEVSPGYLMGWESKDAPYEKIEIVTSILKIQGYIFNYDTQSDMYCFEKDGIAHYLSDKHVLDINDNIEKYFNFCIDDAIKSDQPNID